MNTFLQRFPGQLGFWTLHGLFNALPSFIIVIVIMKARPLEVVVPAMLLAISIFIISFALVTSLVGPLAEREHVLARALRLGTKIRTGIASLSLLMLLDGEKAVMLCLDTWCGLAAVVGFNFLVNLLGMPRLTSLEANAQFFPIFAITILEGLVITFVILMISFFCVIALQSRARRAQVHKC